MATAEVTSQPKEELPKSRKPFSKWMRGLGLGTLKGKSGGDGGKKNGGKKTGNSLVKNKKNSAQNGGPGKNNPYPESGHLQQNRSPASSANGHLSFATSRPPRESFTSSPRRSLEDRDTLNHGNKSRAPTLATNPDTLNSDTDHSKATTTTTRGGALSTTGPDSTFSSPNQSQRSLTTTLTTIQSTSAGNALQNASNVNPHHHGSLNNPNPGVMFSHQFPTSPAPSGTVSAIPRHVQDSLPNTSNSAGANSLLTDNASIMTLASSSKRRRRSMDTDASVQALAPSSTWGGSRESLPLSMLSGHTNADTTSGFNPFSYSRPSVGGLASAERASVYSSSGIMAPALASERNSYYGKHTKDYADAKSLRSITNMTIPTTTATDDARSITNMDSKSLMGGDVGSLRNYEASSVKNNVEGSVRSGVHGVGGHHARNDSLPGSVVGSPLASPRHMSASGAGGGLSRRSSDWAEIEKGAEHDERNREGDGREREGEVGKVEGVGGV